MRKTLLALSAILSGIAFAPDRAAAQGVYVGAGPLGLGVGVGPGYYGYGSGYYGAGSYGYGAPYGYRSYRSSGYYGYGPAVRYRTRVMSSPRVTSYYAAPRPAAQTTTVTTVSRLPGNCGTYFYWEDGRCVDARNKSGN